MRAWKACPEWHRACTDNSITIGSRAHCEAAAAQLAVDSPGQEYVIWQYPHDGTWHFSTVCMPWRKRGQFDSQKLTRKDLRL